MLRQPTEPAEPTESADPTKPAEPVPVAEPAPYDPSQGDRAAWPASSVDQRLQAVLFDMDGLIVDSEPLWFEVECAVMARMGGQWSEVDQQALIGP